MQKVKEQLNQACDVERTEPEISLFTSEGKRKSRSSVLIEIGDRFALFHDQNNEAYADLEINGHRETWPLRSKQFREWLSSQYYQLSKAGADRASLVEAIDALSAKAKFESPQRDVFLRVAGNDDKIYIDLCDADWRVIEIDAEGWRVLNETNIRFIRRRGMLPLPEPEKGGDVSKLWEFLNISKDDRPIVLGFLVSAFRLGKPYVILVLLGESGTAKTTTAKVFRCLIDPSSVPVRAPPKDARDFQIGAVNNWCVTLDNLSGMPLWLSDCMCRLSTGGGFAGRELYTDTDEVLIHVQRPTIVNGIDDVATRSDFAERSVLLTLNAIPDDKKIPERRFWPDFEAERGKIFGALLDRVSQAIANIQGLSVPHLPRMADFVEWSIAAEGGENKFFAAYKRNQAGLVLAGIEGSPVGSAIIKLMNEGEVLEWKGTATQLLHELSKYADDETKRSKAWPKGANWLSNTLRRLGSPLRKIGFDVRLPERERGERVLTISSLQTGNISSFASFVSKDERVDTPELDDMMVKPQFSHDVGNDSQEWERI